MIRRLVLWAVTALALAAVAQLGIGIRASSTESIVIAALVLGLVNTLIRPLARLIALPLTLLTFGLMGWVINGLMLWLVSAWVPGFYVAGFVPAVEGAILLAVISGGMHWLIRR